jgi:hypothetical protein
VLAALINFQLVKAFKNIGVRCLNFNVVVTALVVEFRTSCKRKRSINLIRRKIEEIRISLVEFRVNYSSSNVTRNT